MRLPSRISRMTALPLRVLVYETNAPYDREERESRTPAKLIVGSPAESSAQASDPLPLLVVVVIVIDQYANRIPRPIVRYERVLLIYGHANADPRCRVVRPCVIVR